MGTIQFLSVLLTITLIAQICTCFPSRESGSDEDDQQQQQQQNIDSESLEEFTKIIKGKGGKPPKLQVREKEAEVKPYDPCLDPKNEGACRAHKPRYFLNQATGECEPFVWGGCGRNGNNFRELSECETSCAQHLNKAKSDVQEKKTDDSAKIIETCEKASVHPGIQCLAIIPRWTYNATEQSCQPIIWGGCAKTENNFATETLCQTTCRDYPILKGRALSGTDAPTTDLPPKQDTGDESNQNICDLPSDTGLCLALLNKYYFNKLANRCELFVWGGCGGNKNRFDTAEQCMRTCGGDSPANDVNCIDVECPWALYEHYSSLGCSPIYDGQACCPTRYECPDQQESLHNNTLESRSLTIDGSTSTTPSPEEDATPAQKCRYKGKEYKIGESVDEASDTGNCRAACTCVDSSSELGPSIICAQIECPEHLGGRPPGMENCIPLYKKGSCCAHDYHCTEDVLEEVDPNQRPSETKALAKCDVDGEAFYEGQRVYPNKSPCSKCLCERNSSNGTSLVGQLHCEKVDCGIEIYYSHHLARGCAPVYFEKSDGTTTCCPISWQCPEDGQGSNSKNEETTTPKTRAPETPTTTPTPRPIGPVPPSPPSSVDPTTSPLLRSKESCEMEKVEGNCKGQRPRYYFNRDTLKCENFTYTGCGGNWNNFASLEDCAELCESTLASSASGPLPPNPPAKGGKTSSGGGLFGRSRQIETTPSSQQETKSISLREVDPCTMKKRVGRCKGFFPRFFYSPEDNECKLFIFGGCHPNANNFYSKESCEATCLHKIPVENLRTSVPAQLADLSSNSRQFNSNDGDSSRVNFGDHPESRQDSNRPPAVASVEEDLSECKLPPRTGRCKAFVKKFYYDEEKKACKPFTYGGCGGNANNFANVDECNQKCIPQSRTRGVQRVAWRLATVDGASGGNWESTTEPSPSTTQSSLPRSTSLQSSTAKCKLPKSTGSCHNSVRSFYYDAETKSCKMFFYSGCFGNANRFGSREDCENECHKPLELEETRSAGINDGSSPHNQPPVHELVESTEKETESVQQKTEEKGFCKLDPAPGNCGENQLRFYYDPVAEQCLPFVYTGCGGNGNKFVTEAECISSCGNRPTLEQLSDDLVLSCSYGNETIPLGGKVGNGEETEYSGEEPPCGEPVCQCITPPAVTCVQRMCPEPTTTTQAPKICATPTCLHFCRQTTGPDGCPTCDCDYNRESATESTIKYVPVKSVKG